MREEKNIDKAKIAVLVDKDGKTNLAAQKLDENVMVVSGIN